MKLATMWFTDDLLLQNCYEQGADSHANARLVFLGPKLVPFGIWAFQTTLVPNPVYLFCMFLHISAISAGTSTFFSLFFSDFLAYFTTFSAFFLLHILLFFQFFMHILPLFDVLMHVSSSWASSRLVFQAYSWNGTIVTVPVQSNDHFPWQIESI